jgi:hypothetical protein
MTTKILKVPLIAGLSGTILMFGIGLLMFDFKLSTLPVLLVLSIAIGAVQFVSILHAKKLAIRLYKMTDIELAQDEELIKNGEATHFIGRQWAGGRLALTDKRLIFKTHKNNSKIYQVSFELSRLKKVNAIKTLNLIMNGLLLELEDNTSVRFIVEEPNKWVDMIQKQKTHE